MYQILNLGLALASQAKCIEAQAKYRRALEWNLEVLGHEYSETVTSLHIL